jgi:hypothetical protein
VLFLLIFLSLSYPVFLIATAVEGNCYCTNL